MNTNNQHIRTNNFAYNAAAAELRSNEDEEVMLLRQVSRNNGNNTTNQNNYNQNSGAKVNHIDQSRAHFFASINQFLLKDQSQNNNNPEQKQFAIQIQTNQDAKTGNSAPRCNSSDKRASAPCSPSNQRMTQTNKTVPTESNCSSKQNIALKVKQCRGNSFCHETDSQVSSSKYAGSSSARSASVSYVESESVMSCHLFAPRSACGMSSSNSDSAESAGEHNEDISEGSMPKNDSCNIKQQEQAIAKQKQIIKQLAEKIEFSKLREQEIITAREQEIKQNNQIMASNSNQSSTNNVADQDITTKRGDTTTDEGSEGIEICVGEIQKQQISSTNPNTTTNGTDSPILSKRIRTDSNTDSESLIQMKQPKSFTLNQQFSPSQASQQDYLAQTCNKIGDDTIFECKKVIEPSDIRRFASHNEHLNNGNNSRKRLLKAYRKKQTFKNICISPLDEPPVEVPVPPPYPASVNHQKLFWTTSIYGQDKHSYANFQQSLQNAISFAKTINSQCISKQSSVSHGIISFRFRCNNGHGFYLPVDKFENNYFAINPRPVNCCHKCQQFYDNCKDTANSIGLTVLDGLLDTKITLRCDARGHEHQITYNKKLVHLSCLECRREEREAWKEKIRQEEEKANLIYAQMQADLFEKARREMEANLRTEKLKASYFANSNSSRHQHGSSSSWQGHRGSGSSTSDGRDQMHYFAMAEQQINQMAARQTKLYIRDLTKGDSMSSNNSPSSSSQPQSPADIKVLKEKVFLVYKFLATPLETIIKGIEDMMHQDQANNYFKKLAKQLHPDKNQHPQAKEAFQKVLQAMETARKSVSSTRRNTTQSTSMPTSSSSAAAGCYASYGSAI